jgi:predicted PurR-regulated permease PerM
MLTRPKTSHRSNHYINRQPPSIQSPKRKVPWSKILWMLGLTCIVIAIFWILRPIFALLAASAGIAYICDPIIDSFESSGFSRTLGIAIFSILATIFILLFVLLLIPPIVNQIDSLSSDLSNLMIELQASLEPMAQKASSITGREIKLDFETLKALAPQWLNDSSPELQEKIVTFVKGLFTQGLGLVNTLLNLTLLPVFTFYLLRDWDKIVADINELIPLSMQPTVQKTMKEVDKRLNAFVRGQIKVCLALAILYTVGLLIVGIDLAVPIGIISGFLFIIPYVGTIFGVIISSLLALIQFGVTWHIIGVLGVFGVSQMIEGYLLTPKIVGDSVGLSPLVVMISLIVGASLLGIWGMFLAIPVTAILSVFVTEWLRRYKSSQLFTKPE